MTRLIVPAALALAALVPAARAQTPPAPELTAQQTTALRCSVAFALAADGQAKGDPAMAEYPALGERGREFFVRSSAQIMDQTGMTREQRGRDRGVARIGSAGGSDAAVPAAARRFGAVEARFAAAFTGRSDT